MGKMMQLITILLTEGYSDWEIATLAGVGRAFYGADFSFVSPDGAALKSAAGISVADLGTFCAPDAGVVVVCGGAAFEHEMPPDISLRLQRALQSGCVVGGICGGTIALARAGLLDDVQHTSNGPGYLSQHVPQYAGNSHYIDEPRAIRDRSIITAPAPAPASFAAAVLVAAGLEVTLAKELKAMLAAEHVRARQSAHTLTL